MQQNVAAVSPPAEEGFADRLMTTMATTIVGQREMLERIVIALLSNGHVLIEGAPGLAKTRAVTTLAAAISASFRRIQFTPDLLPADLVGTMIYEPKQGEFRIRRGPIFANIVLADEINRAPAKVQSALLEAMQERQVTIGDQSEPLPAPFMVLATQNPIEQDGTYPLPEAQMDRFIFMLRTEYPDREQEIAIMDMVAFTAEGSMPDPVVSIDEIVQARAAVDRVRIEDSVKEYMVDLVRATRHIEQVDSALDPYVTLGASPRATIYLAIASRARAYLQGRNYVTPHDVKAIAPDVLRHRILTSYEAEADGVTTDDLIKRILEHQPVP